MSDGPHAYWSLPTDELLRSLGVSADGLSAAEAARRLEEHGPNALEERRTRGFVAILFGQLRNPLAWLLIFAVAVSTLAREWTDAVVVTAILVASALLGATQEHRATRAVDALRSRVALKTKVLRDGKETLVDAETIVPGDVCVLSAGSLVPADGVLLAARDFEASQAVLTGETFPVEKACAPCSADAALPGRTNVVFQGTSVRSGVGHELVVRTGRTTEYGRIAGSLATKAPETEFDRGIRQFGGLLTRIMFFLVILTFAATVLEHKPAIDSLLFAIALAVGLAPEMLPAVIAINLSRGARAMAERGVIVRRLPAIENLGAMDVLCTDKTGTLTEGNVGVDRAIDARGEESQRVLALATLNARLQTGLANPLDAAILAQAKARAVPEDAAEKIDELPYDFARKRLSVAVRRPDGHAELVTKGAFAGVLAICTRVRDGDAIAPLDDARRAAMLATADALGGDGFRVLAVATRAIPDGTCARDDEREMILEGMLVFLDPPKAGVTDALASLAALGVSVKVISGDARNVSVHLAKSVGLNVDQVLTGAELAKTKDEALWNLAARTTVFAEVDPGQKERVIRALRHTGHVVGYMGDGINDAPALHAADVALSVDGAADVAREAADFVLLRRDLDVLRAGIETGRRTFANTMKYIFTTESANFGNMLSMAVAAAFLPFLPMLASQVLLNNFLSDVPAMAIGGDSVDREQLERPRRWDLGVLRNFMIVFGTVSSVFDMLTFATLLWVVRAGADEFRTGWFIESLLTEVVVALVVRTRMRFWRSRPSRWLLGASVAVAIGSVGFLYTPAAALFELVPLPLPTLGMLVAVTTGYVLTVELLKQAFFRRFGRETPARSSTAVAK